MRQRRSRSPGQRSEAEGYPSPARRGRIVVQRDRLVRELILIVVTRQDRHAIDRLIRRYGSELVTKALVHFQEHAGSLEIIVDEAKTYRQYRLAFARCGGDRPLLSTQEYGDYSMEHAKLSARREWKRRFVRRPGAREWKLRDVLLLDAMSWDDLIPPAVPPRPADFASPPAGVYDYPARTLLEWGWDLDDERAKQNARNTKKWRPAVNDLVRVAQDEGLLDGWPGEPASWAPYHALNLLGQLGAHRAAGRLFGLMGRENDWLSDRLPIAWGQMGPRAEPPLWEYVKDDEHGADERGTVMLGLRNIARDHPGRRKDVVRRLESLLRRAPSRDDRANAYLVYALNTLQAVEAQETIIRAFEQDKVDTSIIGPENLVALDLRDPDVYERLFGDWNDE